MSELAKPSRASIEFDVILRGNGPVAEALREAFDRSCLTRLRNGTRLPGLKTAVQIREITHGRLVEKWWLEPVGR